MRLVGGPSVDLENRLFSQTSQGLRIALVLRDHLRFCVVGRLLHGVNGIAVAVDGVKLERIAHF